jgi:peptide deformylase
MIYPVRLFGDPILRKTAAPVSTFDDTLRTLADDMIDTMYHYNGVGLAAPQIGIGKRLFIAAEIDPEARDDDDDGPPPQTKAEKRTRWGVIHDHVMVNPVIQARSGTQIGVDGCLSMPGLTIEAMQRDLSVEVHFQDVSGQHQSLTATGHFAHVIQHELDHLDGILFFDRLPESDRRAFMNEHRKELAEMQREAKAFLKSFEGNLPVIS